MMSSGEVKVTKFPIVIFLTRECEYRYLLSGEEIPKDVELRVIRYNAPGWLIRCLQEAFTNGYNKGAEDEKR